MAGEVAKAPPMRSGWHGTHTAILLFAWATAIGSVAHLVTNTAAWVCLESYRNAVQAGSFDASGALALWAQTFQVSGTLAFVATGLAAAGGLWWYARAPRDSGARPFALAGQSRSRSP